MSVFLILSVSFDSVLSALTSVKKTEKIGKETRYGGEKMYRAIICDDEETVRNGLKKHFDWNGHKIEIVGIFEDGIPAFEYMKTHEVDIIITDVRMIHMDGIILAQKASVLYPEVKVLFISGYADVEYLKEALKIDAVDYILKSIDLNELDGVVTKLVKQLDKERSDQNLIREMEEKLEKSMPLLRVRLLEELVREHSDQEESLEQRVHFLNLPLDSSTRYVILVMRIRHRSRRKILDPLSEKEKQEISIVVEEAFADILDNYGANVAFKENLMEYVAVLTVPDEEYEQNLLDAAEELYGEILRRTQIEISVGISEPFQGLCNIQKGYADACEAISRSYLVRQDIPVSVKKYRDDDTKSLKEQAEKEISRGILGGDVQAAKQALTHVMQYVRKIENENTRQNFMISLLLLPAQLMNNMKPENMGVYASQTCLLTVFLQCGGINEQEDMLFSLYEEITEHLKKMSSPHTNTVVECVCQIIAKRYMEQLSVTSLAEMVNLTPAYLCVLFKQAMGKTINEYLTQERMKQAKELLANSNIHLYDVCYKVGYFSPSYFSRIFKKYVGMTPREYRESRMISVNLEEEGECE